MLLKKGVITFKNQSYLVYLATSDDNLEMYT